MRNKILKKSSVIAIMLLFIGAVFVPAIAGVTQKNTMDTQLISEQKKMKNYEEKTPIETIQKTPTIDKDTWPPQPYDLAFLPRVTIVHTDTGNTDTEYDFLASIPMTTFHYDSMVYQSLLVTDQITDETTSYILDDWKTYLDEWGGAQHINFVGAVSKSVKNSIISQYGLSWEQTSNISGTPINVANEIATHDWKQSDYVVIAPYLSTLTDEDIESISNAAALASLYNAPLLFTDPTSLSQETLDIIDDLEATHAILVEIGDSMDVNINNQVELAGLTVLHDLTTESMLVSLTRTLSGKSTLCAILYNWQNLPAALSAARYGGYVLFLPGSIATKASEVGAIVKNLKSSFYKLEKPESLPKGYKAGEETLAQNFYNWLSPLGGDDPTTLETVITFNTAEEYDSIHGLDVTFDKAISGDPTDLTNPGAVSGRMPLDYIGNIALQNRDGMYRATIFANPRPNHVTMAMNAYEVWHSVDSGGSYNPDNWGTNHIINEVFGWPEAGWTTGNENFPWADIQSNPPGLSPVLTPGPGDGAGNDPGQFASFNEQYEAHFHSGAYAGSGSHPSQPTVDNIGFINDLNQGSVFLYISCHGGGTVIAVRNTDNGVAQDSSDMVAWGDDYWPSTDGRVYDGSAGGDYYQSDLDNDIVNVHGAMTAYNACSMANGIMNEILLEHGGAASFGSYTSVSFIGSGWWWNLFVHLITHEGYTIGEAAAYASARVAETYTPGHTVSGNEDDTLNYVVYGDPNVQFVQHDWTSPEPLPINIDYGGHKPDKPPFSFIVTVDPTSIPVSVQSTVNFNVLDDQTFLPVVANVTIQGWGLSTTQETDINGDTTFTITPPYAEVLDVIVEKEDYDTYDTTLLVTGGSVLDAEVSAEIPSLGVTGVLAPTLEGKIDASSAENEYTLHVMGCGVDETTATTDGTASVYVTPQTTGIISVALLKPGYEVYLTEIAVLTLHLGVTIDPTTLTVGYETSLEAYVTCTESGTPIEDAAVQILGCQMNETAYTDSFGTAHLLVIPTVDGTATITASHSGFSSAETTVRVFKANMTMQTISSMWVNQQLPVSVEVYDAITALPMDDVQVSIAGCGIGITSYQETGSLADDEHKDFYVEVGDGATYISGDLSWDGSADIDMKLYNPSGSQVDSSTSTSQGEFVEADNPVAGLWRIEVYSYNGATSQFWLDVTVEYGVGITGTTVDGETTIVIQPTSTGTIIVTGVKEGYNNAETTISVTAGPTGSMQSTVTDLNTGLELSDVHVELYNSQVDPFTNDPAFEATSDGDGDFAISNIPIGEYTVHALEFGYELYQSTTLIETDLTTTHTIELTPSQAYTIQGYIRDANTHQLLDSTLTVYRDDTGEEIQSISVPTGEYSVDVIPYTYRFRVSAEDHLSHQEIINVVGPMTQDFYLTPAIFTDDVEDGENGWTHSAASGSDLWHISTRNSYSPDHAWYCGSESTGEYQDSMDASLVTPPIELTNLKSAMVSFWHWYDFESGSYSWDGSDVEISVEGGPWEQLTPEDGYDDTEYASSNSAFAEGTPIFAHNSNGWQQEVISLTAYVDNTIQIRFRFGSDGSVHSFEGWYIDDITLFGELNVPRPDLAVIDISFSNEQPYVGDTINIEAILQNIGNENAGAFTVAFVDVAFDGTETLIGTEVVPQLNQGLSYQVATSWVAAEGYHMIKGVADYDYEIIELEEGNNDLYEELLVDSENIAPTCAITFPITGDVVSGVITISGTAADLDGTLQSVWMKINAGPWMQTTGTDSWNVQWNTVSESNGFYDIAVRAYDGITVSDTKMAMVTIDNYEEEYYLQWSATYSGARYQGPQPIGDCDNDGFNEVLLGGRDTELHVMQWNPTTEIYDEEALLTSGAGDNPGGFAIGDVDHDGENEIAVAWDYRFSMFEWVDDGYVQIGPTWTGHGTDNTYDCFIGDFDNDAKNEIILADDPSSSSNPEITVLEYDEKNMLFIEEATWNYPSTVITPMAWVADVDGDTENEIVCVPGDDLVVLDWSGKDFTATTIASFSYETYASVCGDINDNGIPEIAVGLEAPTGYIFEWDGDSYEQLWMQTWSGEDDIIEAVTIGDSDGDGNVEVAFGTNLIHIFEWSETEYVDEATLPTSGTLAPLAIGDCDNDGENEVMAGNVIGSPYKNWVFKHRHATQPDCAIQNPEESSSVTGVVTVYGTALEGDIKDGQDWPVYIRIDESEWELADIATKLGWMYEWNTTVYDDGWHTIYAGSYNGERYSPIQIVNVEVTNQVLCGDANDDEEINVGDAVYLINYVFNNGPEPNPICIGDANNDGDVNVGDAVYLINYIFKSGPAPGENCC